jgi:hypothetical protein
VGKKWSIKISQVTQNNTAQPAVNQNVTNSPSLQNNLLDNPITKAMQTPGEVLTSGQGDTPLFNRNLSGEEFATLIRYKITPEDVFNSIKSSLARAGYNDSATYTNEQIKAFHDRLQNDLIQEYGNILRYLNGDLLK